MIKNFTVVVVALLAFVSFPGLVFSAFNSQFRARNQAVGNLVSLIFPISGPGLMKIENSTQKQETGEDNLTFKVGDIRVDVSKEMAFKIFNQSTRLFDKLNLEKGNGGVIEVSLAPDANKSDIMDLINMVFNDKDNKENEKTSGLIKDGNVVKSEDSGDSTGSPASTQADDSEIVNEDENAENNNNTNTFGEHDDNLSNEDLTDENVLLASCPQVAGMPNGNFTLKVGDSFVDIHEYTASKMIFKQSNYLFDKFKFNLRKRNDGVFVSVSNAKKSDVMDIINLVFNDKNNKENTSRLLIKDADDKSIASDSDSESESESESVDEEVISPALERENEEKKAKILATNMLEELIENAVNRVADKKIVAEYLFNLVSNIEEIKTGSESGELETNNYIALKLLSLNLSKISKIIFKIPTMSVLKNF